jgi:transcription initiation factor TFIID subunit 2
MDEKDKYIPTRNNFQDLQEYFIRNAVITALTLYRDDRGWSPIQVRRVLIDLLRYNDNSNNSFSDATYISILFDCIGNSFLQRPKNSNDLAWCLSERIKYKETRSIRTEDVEEFEFPSESETWSRSNCDTFKTYFQQGDEELLEIVLQQVSRYMVKDFFESSFQNSVTVSCLEVFLLFICSC